MRPSTLLSCLAVVSTTLLATATASATPFTLWIHGRNTASGDGCSGGTPSGWSYWNNGNIGGAGPAGVNPVPVNYDGRAYLAVSNPTVRQYLSAYCKGSNSCYVVAHSNGAAQIGYAMDKYNDPNSCVAQGLDSSSCGPWNIPWVATGGSAAGGSELSNWGGWAVGDCLASDLNTGTMRSMYNHDTVGDRIWGYVYNYGGSDWSSLTTLFLSGYNDAVVSFHSSLHARSSGSYDTGSIGGAAKWDWTQTTFGEGEGQCTTFKVFGHCMGPWTGVYNHYVDAGNGGIMSQVNGYVANNAR